MKKIKNKKNKAVILLSGGMDSAVAAALAASRGRILLALAVDYGQNHKQELNFARIQATRLGCVDFKKIKVPLKQLAGGALLGKGKIRQSGLKSKKLPATYVNFRNGILLALAASWAEASGAEEIWGGWCESDFNGYPDCRPVFLKAFEKAILAGTRKKNIKILTPLTGLNKPEIALKGKCLGVDFTKTWSCYAPLVNKKPCGLCDACRLRKRGLAKILC
jgi:7-cyano-7-deazaguanine synthase